MNMTFFASYFYKTTTPGGWGYGNGVVTLDKPIYEMGDITKMEARLLEMCRQYIPTVAEIRVLHFHTLPESPCQTTS